jgi:micrococcal nuclease
MPRHPWARHAHPGVVAGFIVILALTLAVILLVSSKTMPASITLTAFVTQVHDGDTIYVHYNKATTLPTAIRLYLCNAPELGTAHAQDAKTRLEQLVLFKTVTITTFRRLSYDRLLAFVTTGEGEDVSLTLIREGLARVEILHPEEASKAKSARTLQDKAYHSHLGIWR